MNTNCILEGNFYEFFPNFMEKIPLSSLSIENNYFLILFFSYDEKLRLWDKRNYKTPLETYCSGGGIWRIKQPKTKKNDENFIGLACMHNGFQLLKSTVSYYFFSNSF